MVLVMAVTLYTSRIVLIQLGVVDYGVYSVVGGIVVLLGFFNSAMSSATQRYLAFDIGSGDFSKIRKTFGATLTIHIGIALIVFILAEVIGLWYINNRMVFPSNRLYAVNIVYQFSIFTFLLNIIQVPYNALVIAREQMKVYAYISILEVILKLAAVFLLVYLGGDKLIIYAAITFVVALLICIVFQLYCRIIFKESKYFFEYDKKYYKELISYSGWNLFGNIAGAARGQGNNLVLNLFFGTVINATYGITMQVQSAVQMFVTNFQLAVNPQIIKQFAQGNFEQSKLLINTSSKFSFFLTLLIVAPIILNVDYVLYLWLGTPPNYSNTLVTLCLITILIDSISGPLMTGIQATGKIKMYQIVVGTLVFLNLPLSYLFLKYSKFDSASVVFYIWIGVSFLSLFFRLYYLKIAINFSVWYFIKEVLLRIILVVIITIVLSITLKNNYIFNTFVEFVISTLIYVIAIAFLIFSLGFNTKERNFMMNVIDKFFKR